MFQYYFYLYTYVMAAGIREIVDEFINCDDLALAFLIAHNCTKGTNFSEYPPKLIMVQWKTVWLPTGKVRTIN